MWYKEDVSKMVCNGECELLFKVKEGYEISCVKVSLFWYTTRRLVFI